MLLRKIGVVRCTKETRKDVFLAAFTIFFVSTVFLNVSVKVQQEAVYIQAHPKDWEREQVAGNAIVVASDGHLKNTLGSLTSTKKPVDKHGCRQWFNSSFEDNLKHISQYPRGVADRYMYKIGGNRTKPKILKTDFPVIATAASSQFYGFSQGLLKSVYEILLPKYKNITLIYYDIGLSGGQRKQLRDHCIICEVRKFPFHDLPNHMRKLKTYTWKPVIVKILLVEFRWVWWMDSSVRFKTNDIDRALKYSKDNAILFFTYDATLAVAQQTDVQTMKYFGEDPCKFRYFGEIEATFVLFHFDYITNIVVDQWFSCAVNEMCMAPKGTERKLVCRRRNKIDGRCHRFDQAVLSILLRRLYHDTNDYPLVSDPFHIHVIMRGKAVSYFPQ